jgi:hypothetical protein
MTDKKGKCRFCGIEAYETQEEATRKLIQLYRNLDRQREAWAIDVIKAAVQAIEDVMPSSHDKCPENSVCHLCDIMTLEPHLEALKGLIDEKM